MSVYAIHTHHPKFIFIINFKVMYSFLYRILPENFPEVKLHYKNKASSFDFHDYPKFAIVRNPYRRAVSAFYGKCRADPDQQLQKETAFLQRSQGQLLFALQKVRSHTHEISKPAETYTLADNPEERALLNENFELLKTIGFEEYVYCMELILSWKNPDGHFDNQYRAFCVPGQNPFYIQYRIFKNTRIIKLENIGEDWPLICAQLGKEMTLRKMNRTDHLRPGFETFYTDETCKLVEKLYNIDFKKFGYPRHL